MCSATKIDQCGIVNNSLNFHAYSAKMNVKSGFTLIELSIVLVIIGLIVGGILVGRDLISAAQVRAQISQIEKYQAAVNTFRARYDYLPGDIPEPYATQIGLVSRGMCPAGTGDGNGVIQGELTGNDYGTCGGASGFVVGAGETAVFWRDLTTPGINLIEGSYPLNSPDSNPNGGNADVTGADIGLYLPAAKIGRNNYVYVWSGGWQEFKSYNGGYMTNGTSNQINYFAVTNVNDITAGDNGQAYSNPGLTVAEAYNIDQKIDDGLPQSGRVMAMDTIGSHVVNLWYGQKDPVTFGPTTAATAGSATTCYDNNNTVGPQQYSMRYNGGSGVNCGLSFQFQ
jgi:prepilin-type N-terminal cleavage/methylation domain-containing protein